MRATRRRREDAFDFLPTLDAAQFEETRQQRPLIAEPNAVRREDTRAIYNRLGSAFAFSLLRLAPAVATPLSRRSRSKPRATIREIRVITRLVREMVPPLLDVEVSSAAIPASDDGRPKGADDAACSVDERPGGFDCGWLR